MTLDDKERKNLIAHRIQKAEDLVPVIGALIEQGNAIIAINRIYYAYFYTISALALHHEFTTSKHLQLIGWFNKTYIKEGVIDKRFGSLINKAFEMRTRGDYDDFIVYTSDDATPLFEGLKEFIILIKKLVKM